MASPKSKKAETTASAEQPLLQRGKSGVYGTNVVYDELNIQVAPTAAAAPAADNSWGAYVRRNLGSTGTSLSSAATYINNNKYDIATAACVLAFGGCTISGAVTAKVGYFAGAVACLALGVITNELSRCVVKDQTEIQPAQSVGSRSNIAPESPASRTDLTSGRNSQGFEAAEASRAAAARDRAAIAV